MSETATASMKKLDELIGKYAPIDLATGDHCRDQNTIDLRNIRHHAFSILCELNNLEMQYRSLSIKMEQLKGFKEMAARIVEIYKQCNTQPTVAIPEEK